MAVIPETVAAETILLVEDEPAVRALVVSTLERAGYRVMVARRRPRRWP